MEEFDDPIELELRTEREVAILMSGLGYVAPVLEQAGMVAGMATASNLQIRLASTDPKRVDGALTEYGGEGILTTEGNVSSSAAVGALADEDEVDPDEVTDGML